MACLKVIPCWKSEFETRSSDFSPSSCLSTALRYMCVTQDTVQYCVNNLTYRIHYEVMQIIAALRFLGYRENQDGGVGRHTAPPRTTRTDRESNSKGDHHQGHRK